MPTASQNTSTRVDGVVRVPTNERAILIGRVSLGGGRSSMAVRSGLRHFVHCDPNFTVPQERDLAAKKTPRLYPGLRLAHGRKLEDAWDYLVRKFSHLIVGKGAPVLLDVTKEPEILPPCRRMHCHPISGKLICGWPTPIKDAKGKPSYMAGGEMGFCHLEGADVPTGCLHPPEGARSKKTWLLKFYIFLYLFHLHTH